MTQSPGGEPKSQEPPSAAAAHPIQFEHAEFVTQSSESGSQPVPGLACQACQTPIPDNYYTVNQHVICANCHAQMVTAVTSGSRMGRLARAVVYGVLAGLAGTLIWFGIRKATGYEIGLIAIVVGVMVGGAVKMGSNGRGGLGYQLLAVFLTYSSIAANYMPDIYQSLREWAQEERIARNSASSQGGSTTSPSTNANAGDTDKSQISLGERIFAMCVVAVLVFAFAFAMPVMGGFENIIGLLIIAFALWEAWKINKSHHLSFTGPHGVGEGHGPESPSAAAT